MLSFLRSPTATTPAPKPLSLTEAVKLARTGQITLLDVRESAEVQASGRAKGAVHIPLALVPLKADPSAPDRAVGLDIAKPVAVYCASGMRSGRAVAALQKLGYEAHNIGGFSNWVAAGGAVSR